MKAVTHPFCGVVCEQNIDELIRIFNKKFPTKRFALDEFLSVALTVL